MSSPHPKIYEGFYCSIFKLWRTHEFDDFKVIVDEIVISCNSFILASCSEFFRRLLKSNMKEKLEMVVELENISSTTFSLILVSIYTGQDILTKENVLEVWSAVDELQIQFLKEHCEDFVMTNLSFETFEIYKEHAEDLHSHRVNEHIFNFMLKNFGSVRENEIFLRLDFKYLKYILESDTLEVSSEDIVLYSIFEWVKYGNSLTKKPECHEAATAKESKESFPNAVQGVCLTENTEELNQEKPGFNLNLNAASYTQSIITPLNQDELNERKKYLVPLLKATRYFLASKACIATLFNDKIIQNDLLVKESLFEAFTYKFCDCFQGYLPTTAIRRDCSNVEHVGVYCNKGDIIALSFKQEKLFSFKSLPRNYDSKLMVLNEKLYAFVGFPLHEIYVLNPPNWWMQVKVSIPDYDNQLLIAHKKSIYMFQSKIKQTTRFNPQLHPIKLETLKLELVNPTHALSFYNNIVVFSPEGNNGEEKTAVHSWNTETNVWTKLDNLKFSSQNMTSFRCDTDAYILDSNGNLWKLTNSEIIEITFMAKLWSLKYTIKGVALFRETLYIIGDSIEDMLYKVEGVYTSAKVLKETRNISSFVQYLLPKNELLPANPTTS